MIVLGDVTVLALLVGGLCGLLATVGWTLELDVARWRGRRAVRAAARLDRVRDRVLLARVAEWRAELDGEGRR